MIALGCDHGGFDMKQIVIEYLEEKGIAYKDFGCYDKNSCDYPLFGKAAAEAVAKLDEEMSQVRVAIMDGQKEFDERAQLVSQIMQNLQTLKKISQASVVTAFQKQFMDIYEEGELNKLRSFHEKLELELALTMK